MLEFWVWRKNPIWQAERSRSFCTTVIRYTVQSVHQFCMTRSLDTFHNIAP